MKLIECVPNISEGRDSAVIDAVTREIEETEGVQLLDVDPGQATNRTVITFVGQPEPVLEAAVRVIRRAAELIDMSKHEGAHARMGATDVCPLVPMQGATMQDCIELAGKIGQRVGEELGIPVYLYGEAARTPERRRLPDIRQGEYEALEQKLKDSAFAPDFGAAKFNSRAGATAIGAREFLIAWNVNLNTRSRKMANKIAAELREQGKLKRDAANKFVRDEQGKVLRTPGRFTELQGGGWYIDEYGRAQISFNLMNYKVTSIQDVYDACCEEADKLGVRVTGSELVGLIPLEAILSAGDHYLNKEGATTGVSMSDRIHAAKLSMGLAELGPFEPEKNIIELRYRGAPTGLKAMTLHGFADELAGDSPAPGGGSVAALCGSLAASLAAMVAALTWTKKGMESARKEMGEIGVEGQVLKAWFVEAIDADTDAFNEVLAAGRMPRQTDAQKLARDLALEEANQEATRVPLRVLQNAVRAIELCGRAAEHGNPNSITDAGVGAGCGLAAAEGAALNVRINLPTLSNHEVADEIHREMTLALKLARENAAAVTKTVEAALS